MVGRRRGTRANFSSCSRGCLRPARRRNRSARPRVRAVPLVIPYADHPRKRYNSGFLQEEVMSKICKVCGKKPVVGRTVSHAHNVRPAALRAESAGRPRLDQRRRASHPRLHPLPAFEQSHQSRLTMLSAVSAGSAPKALGPYSQAIRAGQFLFVSGQVPIDPATGELVRAASPIRPGARCKTSEKFCRLAALPSSRSSARLCIWPISPISPR